MAIKKESTENENTSSQWKELVFLYAEKVLQEIAGGLFGKIRASIEQALSNAMRKVMVLFLLLFGVLFIGLCAVHIVNDLTGTSWAGYGSLGLLFVIVSMLLSLATKE
jgi:hypothetical protein